MLCQCPAYQLSEPPACNCVCCQAYTLYPYSPYMSVRHPHNSGYDGGVAALFQNLIQADWSSFGIISASTTSSPDTSILPPRAVAEKVFSTFILRTELLELLALHRGTAGAGISLGLDAAAARVVASQQLTARLSGRDGHTEEEPQILDRIPEMDELIVRAVAWQRLLDTFGGCLEVLLLDDDVHPSNVLRLGPGFRKACLGLSGVAEMVRYLHSSRCCRTRWSLAREIQFRVQSSLGNCNVGVAVHDEDVRMEGAE